MPYNLSNSERDTVVQCLRRDAVLRPLVDSLPFPEERIHLSEIYPALLRSIVGQQVSTQAAAAIYSRLLGCFDLDTTDPLAVPGPEVLAKAEPQRLRDAGLSWSKVKYVMALAAYFEANPGAEDALRQMDDEAAIAELVAIPGVGRWTAEMMLLFALGRMDLLPLDDLAIYQSMLLLYGLDPDASKRELKRRMTAIAEAWRPYRSVACLYLYAWRNEESRKRRNK